MKIEKITPLYYAHRNSKISDNKNLLSKNNYTNYSYNPLAYRDYNVSFEARLFRTPANFFEQDFNRNGMPETMKSYLYDDYEDRQNMPPAQMMRLVFKDIKGTNSLEQVKSIFPDEQLFKNLKDTPGRKARTGIIAEIDLMKQENKSLFKNGEDNLGLYILKKIYLEGKTLKEINKDFEKDISVHYKGLSPIKYETLSAYGIKFPDNAFWKSFTATREDFPYEYKPRKALPGRISQSEPRVSNPAKPKAEKKRFENVKDWEIDKLADGLIKGIGSSEETEKQLKKHNVQDKEALNFVAKYMSEINFVVLEKVHASDEMKDFYENYDNLSDKRKNIFKAYWNSDPQIKKHRSQAMKDTIKLFMDAYGVDGNNDEFRELLEYARGIKSARLKEQEKHDIIQAEYDEMFAKLDEQAVEEDNVKEDIQEVPVDKDKNLLSYTVSPKKHEIRFNSDLTQEFKKVIQSQLTLLPDAFSKRYTQYFLAHPAVSDKYKLTVLLGDTVPEGYEDLVLQKEETDKISLGVNKDFTLKYPYVIAACNQAMVELIASARPKEAPKMLTLDTDQLLKLAELDFNGLTDKQRAELNANYESYMKPVASKEEINKINSMFVDFIYNYKKSLIYDKDSQVAGLTELLHANLKSNPALKKDLTRCIKYSKFVEKYGGTVKILLKDNIDDNLKKAKMELMIGDLMAVNAMDLTNILADNKYNLDTIVKPVDPELYYLLREKNMLLHC